jgi:hypothetical protein
MSPRTRYAKKQAKARQRRRLHAQERLERDRRQAQRAAEALHQALEDLDLPATLVGEIEGRLRSPHALLGTMVGVMFPALFGCRTPRNYVACGAGTRIGLRGFWGPCPNVLGSSGGGVWLWKCWNRSGAMWHPSVRPPRVAGSGPGSGMTRCSTSMGHSWGESDDGGAGSTSAWGRALTGCCSSWSLGMVA